ncbi:MAG TPA: CoA transferase, partial [Actinomycetota bacterium]|nr:CoA transferase [Actinomycetota bacterium]
ALGMPELVEEQFSEDQQEVARRVAEVISRRPLDEWTAELSELDACVAPVNDLREVLADPHVARRGLISSVEGRPVGPSTPVRVEGASPDLSPAPGLGEHTEDLLREPD